MKATSLSAFARRHRKRLGCLTVIVVTVLLGRFGCRLSVSMVLGPKTLEIIKSTSQVESFRMADNEGEWGDDSKPFGGYHMDHAGPVLGADFTARLRNQMLDYRSY